MNNLAKKTEIALRDKTHLLPDVAMQPPVGADDYDAALWATGVKVLGSERFGSYQGDWWALVEFQNRERYFINGSFGSCSVCDAFQAQFESGSGFDEPQDRPDYLHRLKAFGREYLTDCRTYEQAMEEAATNESWDLEAGAVIAWIKATWETAQ